MRHGPNGDFVYVLNDDRTVSVRAVTRGIATTDLIAVDKGLEVGERVVTEGGDRLKDGARVQLAADRAGLRRIGRLWRPARRLAASTAPPRASVAGNANRLRAPLPLPAS